MASDIDKEPKRHATKSLVLVFLLAAGLAYFGLQAVLSGSSSSDEGAASIKAAPDVADAPSKKVKVKEDQPDMSAVQTILQTRVCGSPAVDGYAHVKPECLEASPTAKWWKETKPKPDDLDIHIERHADYDGLAVGWGIGNTKANVEECAEACRQHVPMGDGPYGNLPCNAFAFCPDNVCFEPDAHSHHKGDCWLKFTEGPAAPEVNMRGKLSKAMQQRHPHAQVKVAWHSGVLLPHGVQLTNGSWSPRHTW